MRNCKAPRSCFAYLAARRYNPTNLSDRIFWVTPSQGHTPDFKKIPDKRTIKWGEGKIADNLTKNRPDKGKSGRVWSVRDVRGWGVGVPRGPPPKSSLRAADADRQSGAGHRCNRAPAIRSMRRAFHSEVTSKVNNYFIFQNYFRTVFAYLFSKNNWPRANQWCSDP